MVGSLWVAALLVCLERALAGSIGLKSSRCHICLDSAYCGAHFCRTRPALSWPRARRARAGACSGNWPDASCNRPVFAAPVLRNSNP